MDSFIKKIFLCDGKNPCDELVHLQFQKFSRGEFKDKAALIYSKGKDKYSLSSTYEYANELVRALAEKLNNEKTQVTGVIVTTRDLTGQLNFSGKKQFAGVKQYILNGGMSGREIIDLLDRFPAAFFALSFQLPDGSAEIKIKPKAPISGKPSTKSSDEQKLKADFCKLYTPDKSIIESFIFDKEIADHVKKAEIKHTFIITDIILPKGETEPAKIREKAVRKGKIVRDIKIEETHTQKEANFSA